MITKHVIINGDSRQMNELKDQSVHLIITYWQVINAHLLKAGLAKVDD
ncbi:MAG: hypothetical protein LBC68_12210 [Prevotellaceae bacterium]|jgi:hypothetical protein|nr:hypothetical protein [Prevotellaceae bacterium]